MLKYIVLEQGIKQDKNALRCPNCSTGKENLRINYRDRIHTCKKCLCKFATEYENEKSLDSSKPINVYTLSTN